MLMGDPKSAGISSWYDGGSEPDPLFPDAGATADRPVRLVPAEVRELAAFGNLFTDPGPWTSLFPVHDAYRK